MMRLAPGRNSIDRAAAGGGGLLLRICAWFAANIAACGREPHEPRDIASHDAALRDVSPAVTQSGSVASATLLPFPTHGAALLVRLAGKLRDDVARRAPKHDPFFFVVTRRPRSRLTIDRDAFVEFDAERAIYFAVIEATLDTKLTIETSDFDSVVEFVVQYVNDRLSDQVVLEAVS